MMYKNKGENTFLTEQRFPLVALRKQQLQYPPPHHFNIFCQFYKENLAMRLSRNAERVELSAGFIHISS